MTVTERHIKTFSAYNFVFFSEMNFQELSGPHSPHNIPLKQLYQLFKFPCVEES
jgi:hypothetical protein